MTYTIRIHPLTSESACKSLCFLKLIRKATNLSDSLFNTLVIDTGLVRNVPLIKILDQNYSVNVKEYFDLHNILSNVQF